LTTRRLGESSGAEQVTLATHELPAHTHSLGAVAAPGDDDRPVGRALARSAALTPFTAAAADTAMAAPTLQSAGGDAPHGNMQPWLAVTFIIALAGVFPPRS